MKQSKSEICQKNKSNVNFHVWLNEFFLFLASEKNDGKFKNYLMTLKNFNQKKE